jgi:hypothetical protein
MSALGQKRTLGQVREMSALPPKADMCSALGYVRFVPEADINAHGIYAQDDNARPYSKAFTVLS